MFFFIAHIVERTIHDCQGTCIGGSPDSSLDFSVMNTLSERIKIAMEAKKVSQSELARRLNVTRGAVHLWCSSATKELTASNALRIARELKVNPYWLVFGEGSMEPLQESKLESKQLQIISTINNLGENEQDLALRLLKQISPA